MRTAGRHFRHAGAQKVYPHTPSLIFSHENMLQLKGLGHGMQTQKRGRHGLKVYGRFKPGGPTKARAW